jgi:cytochrome d ubiquinol oxidase subunit II
MLFSFIARGVSIEMISNSPEWPRWWGRAFMTGSTVAAFAQGTVIGTVVQGVRVGAANRFSGGTFDFLSGYSVLAGVTTVVLYALAGAAMAKLRADDDRLKTIVARWGRRLVPVAASLVVLSGALLSVAGSSTLVIDQPLRITLLSGACFTAACMFASAWRSFGRGDRHYMPFVTVIGAEVAGVIGLLVLLYPTILPPTLTIAGAASPTSSLDFLLGGFGMLIPLVVAYNAYAFWILRPPPRPSITPQETSA